MNEVFARILDSLACPQCGSSGCGPYRCRFSALTHSVYRQEERERLTERSEELDQRARKAGL